MGTRRWGTKLAALVAALGVLGVVAACDDGGAPATDEPVGSWTRHRLGEVRGDMALVTTTRGEDVVALRVDGAGSMQAELVGPTGEGRRMAVVAEPSTPRALWALADGPHGLVALGSHLGEGFRTFVVASGDGSEWSEVVAEGLDVALTVSALVGTTRGYVGVGYERVGERSGTGPFAPLAMTSPDGRSWTRTALPFDGREGDVRSVVELDGGALLATGVIDGGDGVVDRQPVAWRSDDGGASWTTTSEPRSAAAVVVAGETLLAAEYDQMSFGVTGLQRSDDRGRSWASVDSAFADGSSWAELAGGAGGFAIAMTEEYVDPFSDPLVCYANPDRCGPRGPGSSTIVVSGDGTTWGHLDVDALDGLGRPQQVRWTGSGDVAVVGDDLDGGWSVWRWEADQGSPPTMAPDVDTIEYEGPPLLRHGETPEVGATYAFPLSIHCGMHRLGELGGRRWGLVEGTAPVHPETGGGGDPVPQTWPVVSQSILGYVTRVSADRIEYSLPDGEVIAEYAPLPEDAPAFGCA